MPGQPLHVQIAQAILEGFGGKARVQRTRSESLVFVNSHPSEPIIVRNDDVLLPDALKIYAPGIRLDVQAILAAR